MTDPATDMTKEELEYWTAIGKKALRLNHEDITYRPDTDLGIVMVQGDRLSGFEGEDWENYDDRHTHIVRACFDTPFGRKYANTWVKPEDKTEDVIDWMVGELNKEMLKCLKSLKTVSKH